MLHKSAHDQAEAVHGDKVSEFDNVHVSKPSSAADSPSCNCRHMNTSFSATPLIQAKDSPIAGLTLLCVCQHPVESSIPQPLSFIASACATSSNSPLNVIPALDNEIQLLPLLFVDIVCMSLKLIMLLKNQMTL